MELTLKNHKNKILVVIGMLVAVISVIIVTQSIKSALAVTTGNILPSADGAYLQWRTKPATSTTHYTLIDESSCNGTTDYNFTNTTSNRDSYKTSTSSIPDNVVISSITITPCASRNIAGNGSSALNVFYRYNGVNSADGGNYNLPIGVVPVTLTSTNFTGLSLLKTASTTLEIGAVLTSGNKGVRLSKIVVNITYSTSTPTVTTTGATSTTDVATYLTGSGNPNGIPATGWFRYSTTTPGTCNDSFGIRNPLSGGVDLGSGTSFVPFSATAKALTPSTTYYYCAIASNVWGTVFGLVVPFTTLP